MSAIQRTSVTEEQWKWAADDFELGRKHAVEIAAELGVSPATVSREFKRRGCRKACRVAESVAKLEAALDAKARREAHRRRVEKAAVMERLAAMDALIGEMVKSLVAAERAGNLSSAVPEIVRIGKTLGVKTLR
jgi:IS30 family transposase